MISTTGPQTAMTKGDHAFLWFWICFGISVFVFFCAF